MIYPEQDVYLDHLGNVYGLVHYPEESELEKIDLLPLQYVDLYDKNGNQYCQDDIVRYENKNYRLIKGLYMFELLGFSKSSQDNPSDFFSEEAYKKAEIVGNFHINPELLNK